MTEPSLPTEVCSRLDRIGWYTIRLTDAARANDLQEVTALLEKRAQAVDELETEVKEFHARIGSREEELLMHRRETLELQAATALDQLTLMLDGMRAAAQELSQQTSAVRSYVEQQLPSSALNRSG